MMNPSEQADTVATTDQARQRLDRCREILRELGSVVIGVSGGVDSSLLLTLAVDELGAENVLAATATGLIHPARDAEDARRLAASLEVDLVEFDMSDVRDRRILDNPPDRCYWCKRFIFAELSRLSERRGFAAVASGSNADDVNDIRPGARAENELDIARPLQQAGMTKADIRIVARELGIAAADRPSSACLASRVPYGRPLDDELLRRIEAAEDVLRRLGFEQCRVRDHDTVARVEIPQCQLPQAVDARAAIVRDLKAAGYTYVVLDLEGFRSGAMNETLGA
ncbi:MAG: ATP-dependent sacrificial sulfur transferase LarE [Planctomycetes bacterium]|jgi:uncharacterized protein|nr:ATP-dependent sacrificial sulfur transferase LarE [Phycisphaerae bacterium]NBB96291.1 ATP-dependent sacrificial sulfur transferase LarE [Planctomycetota bacterium]